MRMCMRHADDIETRFLNRYIENNKKIADAMHERKGKRGDVRKDIEKKLAEARKIKKKDSREYAMTMKRLNKKRNKANERAAARIVMAGMAERSRQP